MWHGSHIGQAKISLNTYTENSSTGGSSVDDPWRRIHITGQRVREGYVVIHLSLSTVRIQRPWDYPEGDHRSPRDCNAACEE